MSIDYKEYKKSKKENTEYNLGIPPQDTSDKHPGFVWDLSKYNGIENAFYEYINTKWEYCFVVRRYEPHSRGNPGPKKKITPYSYDLKSKTWVHTWWEKDRPLFRAHKIKGKDQVIIFEGEKTVIAAEKIFKDYVCLTWSGGSKAVDLTDYKPLQDKKVILWPDNDKTGINAMHEVAKILIENGITDHIDMVLLPPKQFKEGWDIADEITADGITYQGLLDLKQEYDPDEHVKIWEKIDKRLNKKNLKSKLEELQENYTYIRAITSFFEKSTFKIISKEMINDWNLEHTQDEESLSRQLLKQKDLVKTHGVLTHAGLAPGVVNVAPGQFESIDPGSYYNTYRPSGIVSKSGNVDKILEYYSWYIGRNWKTIEQYIAFMVQHPGVKIRWSPTITSVEGGGKNILGTMISRILGDHNCNTQLKFDHVTSKFANVLLGLQFGVINELDLSSRKNIKANTSALKNIIADSTLTIELKGKPQIKIPNFANFFIYSNDDDCLHLTKDSRRYFITTIKHTQEEINQKLEDDGYKDFILDALEFGNDSICYLKNHFENVVKIDDPKLFSKNAPKTEDFDEMVEKSRPGIHRALDYRLESNIFPFENFDSWTEIKTDPNNKNTNTHTKVQFSGMVIAEELFTICVSDKIFSKEYVTRDLIISWCNQHCIPWFSKDGQNLPTKQIIVKNNGATHKPRAYLIKDLSVNGRKLSTLTEGELGQHHSQSHSYLLLNSTNFQQHTIRLESVYAETDKGHSNFS